MAQKKHAAWTPAPWTLPEASAIQALARGEAEPYQQKLALDWIINQAAGTYDEPFNPGGEDGRRDTDFALGKSNVGRQIVKLININLSKFKAEKGEQP